ncbi:hypothetical protein JR316_0011413 [Psilocybe cubensis]|uniref:Uncharacterized protein n=2 Tax=Psilocybe cubensis TaxID=181762 RepID=A0ACB8GJQ3_PSICU|nr:hypothetical protein JR316_0011413 [Psilocybe cubensis]KAH9475853.1 hypothetical protein JR316_0011413 [Psilocybe cubensis]
MKFEEWMAWIYTGAISFTSLLFTFRVRAIFEGNRYVTAFFGILWLVVVGTALMTTQGDTAGQIGSTKSCVNEHFKEYVTGSAIAPLVNDTLVFLAISWRLMQNSLLGNDRKFCIRAMILGKRMPSFSRALLKDGQVYYLTTVSTNLLTLILMLIHPVPEAYRTMLAGPNIMLMNVMACRVYRKTKLGLFANSTTQSSLPTFRTENTFSLAPDQRDYTLSPITFRKVHSQGDPLDGGHNVTIDLGTKELFVDNSLQAIRAQSSSIFSEHEVKDDPEKRDMKPSL